MSPPLCCVRWWVCSPWPRGVPRPLCLSQAVSPLATRAMAVSFVWSPVGQAGHRNRAHVLKFRGRLDAGRAQLVILTRPRSKEALWAREPQILTLSGHSLL